jgi:hypothetical protein
MHLNALSVIWAIILAATLLGVYLSVVRIAVGLRFWRHDTRIMLSMRHPHRGPARRPFAVSGGPHVQARLLAS